MERAATKSEIDLFKSELKADMQSLHKEVKSDIRTLEQKIRESELRMTIRLGGMIMAPGGMLIAIKFLG